MNLTLSETPKTGFGASRPIYEWPWNTNVNGNVQPPVDCERWTKYSAILIEHFGEYIIEFMEVVECLTQD